MKHEFQKSLAGCSYTAAVRCQIELGRSVTVEDAFALPPLGATTPFGAPVVIFQVNSAGRIFIEGRACKGAPTGRKRFEHWVTFAGESRPKKRRVLPGAFQTQAESILQGLLAIYEDMGAHDLPDTFLSDVIRHAANDNSPATEEEA